MVERRMVPFYEPLHTFAIWIEHPATNELEIFSIADCKRQWFFDECFMLFSCNRMSIRIASGFGIVSFRFFLSHSRSISQTFNGMLESRFLYCQRNICLVPYRFRYSTSPFEIKHYFILLAGIFVAKTICRINQLVAACVPSAHTHTHILYTATVNRVYECSTSG